MINITLHKRVRNKILGRITTQADIAEEVGLHPATISGIVKGHDISVKTLELIDLKLK